MSTPATSPTKFDTKSHIDATKKEWLRKQQLYREMYYAKSRLPPMNIEPFPLERQRLPFKMSAEDRALRQQWLRDQFLSNTEPRHVPELRPRNFFRRVFGYPWDVATKGVINVMGMDAARYFRYIGPKLGLYVLGLFSLATYFKYNHANWEKVQGWNIYYSKMPTFPGEPLPENPPRDCHEKSRGDFNNRGFAQRKTHLELN